MQILKVDYGKSGKARAYTNTNDEFQKHAWAHGAFRTGTTKVLLTKEFKLYKFTSSVPVSNYGITPWWSAMEPYGNDAGLRQRISLAARMGCKSSELTGVVAAVSEDWNGLTHIQEATLKRPVWAYWGQCAKMPRLHETQPRKWKKEGDSYVRVEPVATTKGISGEQIPSLRPGETAQGRTHAPTKFLLGYAWQLFIPNLQADDIEFAVPYMAP